MLCLATRPSKTDSYDAPELLNLLSEAGLRLRKDKFSFALLV
jgi:hypothetical protein